MMEMAKRAANISDTAPPLLVWRETSEIERLAAECAALAARAQALRPHSHYRIELEARLRALRCRQIALECELRGGR